MAAKTLTATVTEPLTVAEVRAALDRGRAALPAFVEAWPQEVKYRVKNRARPASLARSAGLEFVALQATGIVAAASMTPDLMGRMLRLAAEALPTGGEFTLWVRLVTQGKSSPGTTSEFHGEIEALWKERAHWLGFRPGSKIPLDRALRDGTFERAQKENLAHEVRLITEAIARAGVPLEEVPQSNGRTFRHTAGGRWTHFVSQRDVGPLHFCCEMPGASPDDIVAGMETLIDLCESTLPRSYEYRVSASGPDARRAYEFARSDDWPLKEIEVAAAVRLSGAGGLEALRAVAPPGGIAVKLAEFRLPSSPGGKPVALSAKVRPGGCEVILKLPDGAALPDVARRLALSFQEPGPA
jgi:hypothetical protein